MTQLAAVTPELHASKVWKRRTDYAFAAAQCVVPLAGAELSMALPMMPVGFTRDAEAYQLVAIMSLQPGVNLFVAPGGQWLGTYIPAALRAHPFCMARPQDGSASILCVDEDSGLVVDAAPGAEAFFDDQRQPSPALKEVLDFLSLTDRSRVVTQQAVNALANANVITAWSLNLKHGDQTVPVHGLYRIDEAALRTLAAAEFLALREVGALPLAYAQLLSMAQLTCLERLTERRRQLLAPQQAAAEQQTLDRALSNLDGFALSQDDLTLKFD